MAPPIGIGNFEAEMSATAPGCLATSVPEIPQRRYVCFYPMNKFRGETKNWDSEPFASGAG